jgi:hypothetical protein
MSVSYIAQCTAAPLHERGLLLLMQLQHIIQLPRLSQSALGTTPSAAHHNISTWRCCALPSHNCRSLAAFSQLTSRSASEFCSLQSSRVYLSQVYGLRHRQHPPPPPQLSSPAPRIMPMTRVLDTQPPSRCLKPCGRYDWPSCLIPVG